jgi:hypothetical protein
MTPIYGCSTDMGSILSRGQGEAAAATVVAAAASFGPDEGQWVSSVSMPTRVSLKCAGWIPQDRGFESELDRSSRIEREHVARQRVCS